MNKNVTLKGIEHKLHTLFSKIPLIMRLSILFLFLSVGMALAENTYAQSAEISVSLKNETIAKVLEAIEGQSEFTFVYDNKIVNTNKTVSIEVDNKNIFDVLNQLFVDVDIAYTIVNPLAELN